MSTACRCDRSLPNANVCVKCGRPIIAVVVALPPPRPAEVRRRQKISAFNRGRQRVKRPA